MDHQALLAAEAAAIQQAEDNARKQEEAEARRREDAQPIAPKQDVDTAWILNEALASGEHIYYTCTGLEKADAVSISFILSADGTSARNIQTIAFNADGGKTFYAQMNQVLMMSYPIQNGRLTVDSNGILLDVTISGDRADGVLEYGVENGENALGRMTYVSCGIARIEMKVAR